MHYWLIVCVGNICRSPMAQAVLRAELPAGSVRVVSAGLAARVGEGVHPVAAGVLAEHGLDARGHQARQLDRELLLGADLVLAMEHRHVRALHALAPPLGQRIQLLGRWENPRDIRDPCGHPRAAFVAAFEKIQHSARHWCKRIA